MKFINCLRSSRFDFSCATILILVIFGVACAGAAFAASDASNTPISVDNGIKFFSAISNFIVSIFTAINSWLKNFLGFNFTDLANLIIKIVAWMIDMLIKGFYWLIKSSS